MACIIKKIVKGRPYYYAAESARVNGKPPRIIWQKYLGTLDDIIQRKEEGSDVTEVDIFEAGCVAAMLGMFEKIQLIEIIDDIIPKRKQGPSVGQYIALAAINRIVNPCSKLSMPDWYKKSILYRLWKFPPEAFNSQRFWDHMDLIKDDQIDMIQEKIANNVKNTFSIAPEVILYDTTNFFTYIATRNSRNTIARRGKSKAKRNDLRQVGLALLVSKDFQIPLFHSVYQGNLADRGIFADMSMKIKGHYENVFGKENSSTLVFDKGNVSDDAMEKLIISGQHFVCALPKNMLPAMFSKPFVDLKEVPGISGTKAFSSKAEIWGKEFKAVVAYSEGYFSARIADLTEKMMKCEQKLRELDKSISESNKGIRKTRRSKVTVEANIKSILSEDYMKEIFNVTVNEKPSLRISYSINHERMDHIIKQELGRTVIISTHLDWDEKSIISSYRDQSTIEDMFKYMKNKEYLHWQPEFHWTDQKIKVHGLYCVMALLAAMLAHKIIRENGIEISLFEMIKELADIREVGLIYQTKQKRKSNNKLTISRMSPRQKRLSELLEIPKVISNTSVRK
jgi:transposase